MARLPAFSIDISMPIVDDTIEEKARLEIGYINWNDDLYGNYVNTVCSLIPATLEYNILVERQTLSLPRGTYQGKVIHVDDKTKTINLGQISPKQPSLLLAINFYQATTQNSNASVGLFAQPDTVEMYTIEAYSLNSASLLYLKPGWADETPAFGFEDPMQDIIHNFNEMMLRGAALTGTWDNLTELVDPGVAVNQTVTAHQTSTQNVFRSDLKWFAAAGIVQFITCLLILPMFWGWWQLGNNLTMSPFSTGLAMDAPLLREVNSAAGPRGVVNTLGGIRVRFGVVDSKPGNDHGNGRLGLARSASVTEPRSEMDFLT